MKKYLLAAGLGITVLAGAQEKIFTREDSVRGSITDERAWWDVLRYDIVVKPDYTAKTISGENTITYQVLEDNKKRKMQVDLQSPLVIHKIISEKGRSLDYVKDGNAWLVTVPAQKAGEVGKIRIVYSGLPREGVRPPWDGGWTFAKDSLGRPWMTVTCQGLGASVWFPCKDHQSDEPQQGATLTMVVPDTLTAIANGRLISTKNNGDGTTSYTWGVVNPINNYNIIPYIGKYVNFSEPYQGEKGSLDLNYWVLDYNGIRGKEYLSKELHNTLKALEHWFGPYPFYEDGFQLIESPHLGMEHQSAVAYGNKYQPGYLGRDGSGTGWGLKWDFIVVHESGHEWFGNNITTKDIADMWVHEGFTNYSETLFIDYIFGKQAANEYNYGIRKGIKNATALIAPYHVNAKGSGDMYPKGGNLLHTIRHSMNDDVLFREILRGLNRDFYHQTVTSEQVENYMSKKAGFDYTHVFDQYLRTTGIPVFEYYFSDDKKQVHYKWSGAVKGFDLPLYLQNELDYMKLFPSGEWKSAAVNSSQASLFDEESIKKMYYIQVNQVKN